VVASRSYSVVYLQMSISAQKGDASYASRRLPSDAFTPSPLGSRQCLLWLLGSPERGFHVWHSGLRSPLASPLVSMGFDMTALLP
jgi:hypothetical protein